MQGTSPADEIEGRLVSWAHRRDAVRAVLLTSTRAVPGAEVDAFYDYDTVLVVRDVGSFAADREGLLRPTAADELLRRHRVVLMIPADRSQGAAAGAAGIAGVPAGTGVHGGDQDKSITIDPLRRPLN